MFDTVNLIDILLKLISKVSLVVIVFRATYDYEKKVYNEHLESLQVMEKNYMTMASEVEKLRAELKKHAENDRRTGTLVLNLLLFLFVFFFFFFLISFFTLI